MGKCGEAGFCLVRYGRESRVLWHEWGFAGAVK